MPKISWEKKHEFIEPKVREEEVSTLFQKEVNKLLIFTKKWSGSQMLLLPLFSIDSIDGIRIILGIMCPVSEPSFQSFY